MSESRGPLSGRHIIVGVSGGIAAYKAPSLVRLLVKAGAEVRCAVTAHALQFVTELTLETVSGNAVYSDLFDRRNPHSTEHISLKEWGDAMVVAPATANIIGKLANGIADDALSTLLVSFRKPLVMCPAMNTQMLECYSVERNMEYLRANGVHLVESPAGELACGSEGRGRMEEPERIVEHLIGVLTGSGEPPKAETARQDTLGGYRVLITAGPTYERIDAVRFVGNYSTGKMGFALAEELAARGAAVVLVAGPTHLTTRHAGIERIDVESAQEMYDAATGQFATCDAAILSAAVADYRPANRVDYKIKKQADSKDLTLQLTENPDILAALGRAKREGQVLAGFALETNDELANARKKLVKKNLDFIVLNSLHDAGAGFGYDTNKITLIDRDGSVEAGELKSKAAVAADIADHLEGKLRMEK